MLPMAVLKSCPGGDVSTAKPQLRRLCLVHSIHYAKAAGLTAAVCWLSCATSSWAILETTSSASDSGFSTDIVAIDGRTTSDGRIVLEPGRHVVEAVGTSRRKVGGVGLADVAVRYVAALGSAAKSDRMKACFIARAGRTYEVRATADGGPWHIQVIDRTTTYEVQSPCKNASTIR
jgi:hypothetical protein